MREMPQLTAGSYNSAAIDMNAMLGVQQRLNQPFQGVAQPDLAKIQEFARRVAEAREAEMQPQPKPNRGAPVMANPTRRLVQVFIADPDENVPLADCLLYQGEPKLTDLTDQELFFEVDIKSILNKHNEKRVALVNKAVKERTENLEPARIRDLKMTVVTIAQF